MRRLYNLKLIVGSIIYIALSVLYLLINNGSPLDFLLFLIPFFLIAACIPLPSALNSLVPRSLFSIAIYTGGIQILSMLFRVLGIQVTYKAYLVVFLAISAVLLLVTLRSQPFRALLGRLRPRTADYYAIAAALVLLLILLAGTFVRGGLNSTSALRLISGGLDDVSHLSMVGDEYHHNVNLLIGPADSTPVSIRLNSAYPKGWHIVTALGWRSLDGLRGTKPDKLTMSSEIDLYAGTKLVYFFITMLALSATIIWLSQDVWRLGRRPANHHIAGLLAQPAIYLIALVLVAPVFKEGFFSFYPVVFCSLVMLLAGYYFYDKSHTTGSLATIILLLLISAAGVALSWLLVAPALFIYIFLLLITCRRISLSYIQSLFKPKLRPYTIGLLILALVCLFTALAQAWFQAKDYKGSIDLLTTFGAIVPIDLLFSMALLAGFITFVFLLRQRSAQAIIYLSFAIAMETFLIWGYQLVKEQSLSYYFYKLELPLILILGVGAACALIYVSIKLTEPYNLFGPTNQMIASAAFLFVVTVFTLFISGNYAYNMKFMLGTRSFTKAEGTKIESRLAGQTYDKRAERIFYLTKSNNSANVIGTALLRLSHAQDDCDSRLFTDAYKYDTVQFKKDLISCVKQVDYGYTIIVDEPSVYKSLVAISQQLPDPNKVKVEQFS